ncbi:unnamed protein product [Bursaphelenchus xylophilus]|uniref:(pine wood nematode) hypothetical protein n=1 Tax=Bursaphelenchus xylophilus TaxID=6326 RepID=A0A1I7SSG2_BURXY|nr:unnamed protein product [Bursaphelenchus xylophilus]CAG9097583.1 unnamed protein product [Bursaphelenchus xylophilus]
MGIAYSNDDSLNRLRSEYDRQLNRQIVLMDHYWQHKRAEEFATRKEIVGWEVISFGAIATTLFFTAMKKKNKALILPVIPLVTWIGYRMTQATDEYMEVVHKRAKEILDDPRQKKLITLAGGRITLKELDERRAAWKNNFFTSERCE